MATVFENEVASAAASANANRAELSDIYKQLITSLTPAMVKCRMVANTMPNSARGIKELNQILQIMDGGFVRIANEVIAENEAASDTANA